MVRTVNSFLIMIVVYFIAAKNYTTSQRKEQMFYDIRFHIYVGLQNDRIGKNAIFTTIYLRNVYCVIEEL